MSAFPAVAWDLGGFVPAWLVVPAEVEPTPAQAGIRAPVTPRNMVLPDSRLGQSSEM